MLQLSPCAHGWQSSWHRASRGALQEQQHKPHCSSLREHTLTCHIYKPPSSRSLLSSGTLSQNLTTEGQGVRGEYLLSSTGLKVVVAAPCQEERAVSGMIPALPSHPRACFALPPAATPQTQQQDCTGRGPTDAPAHPTSPTALHPAQLPCFPASPCRPHTCTSCFSLGTGCGITFSSPWTNQPNMLPSRNPPIRPHIAPTTSPPELSQPIPAAVPSQGPREEGGVPWLWLPFCYRRLHHSWDVVFGLHPSFSPFCACPGLVPESKGSGSAGITLGGTARPCKALTSCCGTALLLLQLRLQTEGWTWPFAAVPVCSACCICPPPHLSGQCLAPMGCLSVGVGRECPGKPLIALGEEAAAPQCHSSTHSCAHLGPFWHLWLWHHPLKALHQPAQHTRSCPAGRAGVVRAHPVSCTPHPASLHPTSHTLRPSNPTTVHPTLCQTIPNPASHIPCLPQILRPTTRIPHPTIPYPKSLILQSLIPHPSSPISHHSILNPKSHIPHPSILYPTSQITHPTSCIPTPHISHLSMLCLSILNPTPHIPLSHILHPASHILCLPIPYSTSLHPMPPLCLLMGCCTQGTHQLSMSVPKPSSSSQPSSSSSSGSKGVISAGRAGSHVQELATRREPQTMVSLLPLPRASSSSSLRTCTSVWKGRKYYLVGHGEKSALCPELGEGRMPRGAEGSPPGLGIF